mgnify:CR=1 FL=1
MTTSEQFALDFDQTVQRKNMWLILYQVYTYINTLFITNQERTTLVKSRKSDLILPPSNPITPSSMTSNVLVNTNLFFLQN